MSKTQAPQAVNDYLSEISSDSERFMGHFDQVTNRAKEAGITQDQLTQSITRSYGGGTTQSGSREGNRS